MPLPAPVDEASGPAAILLLAVLQGLAEFLPVSSSGHLVLARVAMEVREGGLALDVALHLGTLLAVAWAYRADVGRLFVCLREGRLRMWAWLVVATLPIAVIGVLIKSWIETAAQTVSVAGIGFLVTAALLLAGEWGRKRHAEDAPVDTLPKERLASGGGPTPPPDEFGSPRFSDALLLGLAQTFAILPGISRSGTTISAGLLRGLPATQAARLSFLMSLPAVAGAAIVELPGAFEVGFGGLSSGLVVGAMALAALVGWAALRTLLLVLARGAFRWFAAYCALLGVLALVFA